MAEPALAELQQSEKDLLITWRAFELRPEPVEMLDPHGDYLTQAWQDHVYPLAVHLQVNMKMPPIQPRSRLAHEATKWAASQDRAAEYNQALFRAFFEFGRDIGDKKILMNIAADLGLDPAALGQALDSHQFAPEVLKDQEEAQKLGVRAVPSFVANGRLLASGVQTAERLKELLTRGSKLPMMF